jgi:KAT8 regulatory NSL complex subunit 2
MKSLRKRQPPESLEMLMDELQHYKGNDQASGSNLEKIMTNSTQKLLDYASDTDSEGDIPTAEQVTRQEDDSDADSIDSDQDDPLRYCFFSH